MAEPAPPRGFPLNATITGIELVLDGAPSERGGGPDIQWYNGSQLHYHVNPSSPNRVDIVIDQYGPDSIAGSGVINTVTLVYTFQTNQFGIPPGDEKTQIMTFSPTPRATFPEGKRLQPSLRFNDAMTEATLVLRQAGLLLEAPYDRHRPHIGIWVVAKEFTRNGEGPEGYFIDVPLRWENEKYRQVTQATITWPNKGSLAGPVGGATSP